jgi:Mlc titration factor MtfA (ptsG expression regulator)
MFEELTNEEIVQMKRQITEFLQSNQFGAVQSISVDSGLSMTLNQQNAWRVMEELTKEQRRRRRGGNPFIAIDLR